MKLKSIDPHVNTLAITLDYETTNNQTNQIKLNSDDLLLLETAITELYLTPSLNAPNKKFTSQMCLKINSWRLRSQHPKARLDLYISATEITCILSSITTLIPTIPYVFQDERKIANTMLKRFNTISTQASFAA
ncbi:MAG: hypothetical protein ACJAXJ_003172 [Colwellia sp.]|jgi:hypothetical protein